MPKLDGIRWTKSQVLLIPGGFPTGARGAFSMTMEAQTANFGLWTCTRSLELSLEKLPSIFAYIICSSYNARSSDRILTSGLKPSATHRPPQAQVTRFRRETRRGLFLEIRLSSS